MDNRYDIVMMVTARNINLLKVTLPLLRNNIDADEIMAVAKKDLENSILNLGIRFLDEDHIFEGLTFKSFQKLYVNRGGNINRTGWYYQQFLKYAYAYIAGHEYYLIWDADTIPLTHIDYFAENRPFFVTKKEYHKPYFRTIETLFDGEVKRYDDTVSFIAENMLFKREYVLEIIRKINGNGNLKGDTFFEKILDAVDQRDLCGSGFSEFETYGNYMMRYHREEYGLKKYKTFREAAYYLGFEPSIEQLKWVADSGYEIISIDKAGHHIGMLTKHKFIRDHIRFDTLVKTTFPVKKFRDRLQGKYVIYFD